MLAGTEEKRTGIIVWGISLGELGNWSESGRCGRSGMRRISLFERSPPCSWKVEHPEMMIGRGGVTRKNASRRLTQLTCGLPSERRHGNPLCGRPRHDSRWRGIFSIACRCHEGVHRYKCNIGSVLPRVAAEFGIVLQEPCQHPQMVQ